MASEFPRTRFPLIHPHTLYSFRPNEGNIIFISARPQRRTLNVIRESGSANGAAVPWSIESPICILPTRKLLYLSSISRILISETRIKASRVNKTRHENSSPRRTFISKLFYCHRPHQTTPKEISPTRRYSNMQYITDTGPITQMCFSVHPSTLGPDPGSARQLSLL